MSKPKEENLGKKAEEQPEENVPLEIPAGQPADPAEEYKKKAESYWDQLVRLQAEFVNFRKRAEKEKSEAIRFGRDSMIEHMVALLDVMDQALKHADSSADAKALKQGFQMVVSEFSRLLKAEGLEPIPTKGLKFDPHVHEAVEMVPTEKDSENHMVLDEMQKGYKLNGKLLRPARVKVGKKAEAKKEGDPGESLPE